MMFSVVVVVVGFTRIRIHSFGSNSFYSKDSHITSSRSCRWACSESVIVLNQPALFFFSFFTGGTARGGAGSNGSESREI